MLGWISLRMRAEETNRVGFCCRGRDDEFPCWPDMRDGGVMHHLFWSRSTRETQRIGFDMSTGTGPAPAMEGRLTNGTLATPGRCGWSGDSGPTKPVS